MIQDPDACGFRAILTALHARHDLPADAITSVLEAMIQGRCAEDDAAEFLLALRAKGETADEIAAAALCLRRHMIAWDAGRPEVLDTCGTGGDGHGTFNISTAAALVTAACGVPVVKHGNRSSTSRSGSADVITELGVTLAADPVQARRCLDRVGLAFCHAPLFHPALQQVAALRRRLAVPTLFNWLGPLANPAGARFQLLGVGRRDLLDRMAEALAQFGTERALVVHAADGMDEVSLAGPTMVREVAGREIRASEWQPEDFQIEACSPGELRADNAAASAAIIERVLDGADNAATRIVVANVAAALLVVGRARSLPEGVRLAQTAIESGGARKLLDDLVRVSREENDGAE